MLTTRRIFVAFSTIISSAVFTAAAQAQIPGQFQGFQGGIPGNAFGNQGHPAVNNMGAYGGFPLGFRNRFDFRQWGTTTNTPPVAVTAPLNGRNTTIYSNINPSNYLGSVGSAQLGQFGQNGQFGQYGGGQYGGVAQPGIIYGQQAGGAYGQYGQSGSGQYGQSNMGQFGQTGGVGGKPGANGFNQIGGGGQFGSRYGL